MTGRSLGLVMLVVTLLGSACASAPAADGNPTGGVDRASTAPMQVVLTDVSELVDTVSAGVVAVSRAQYRIAVEDLLQSVRVPDGVGTGIVIDDAGHILTNYHVIEGAQTVTISLPNGDEREARIIGEAPNFDLALLSVDDRADLEPIPLGSSDALDVGDPVVAIGNALGLDRTAPTVSVGIVSARDRALRTPDGLVLEGLLQTDAAINPGNSGGPLLNENAEVVGVNTAILGGAQNLGFAIAIDSIRETIDEFLTGEGGPYLGVQLTDNTPQVARQLRLLVATGALVAGVTPGPGAAAGLRPGDVVVAVDGEPVVDADDLVDAIARSRPGQQLGLTFVRGDSMQETTATVGQRPVLVNE